MTTFTINNDNNIAALSGKPAPAVSAESFTSEKELARITADWPASRLVDTWNSFAGVTPFDGLKPVRRFTDRKAAVSRIWMAIQRVTADNAPHAADRAPDKGHANKAAAKGKRRENARTGAILAREGSKKATVLALIGRKEGASLGELMRATGWQAHSIRGFLSGALGKKMGLKIGSQKQEHSDRTYRLIRSPGVSS
jgi:hypothetical protein